jgi:hypothetical protein
MKRFFQSFLISQPGHPILEKALDFMLHFFRNPPMQHVLLDYKLGPVTLLNAYEAMDPSVHEKAHLLYEMLLDDRATRLYPNIPKQDGVGCCCNFIVHDPFLSKKAYFYSRVVGAGKFCSEPL